MSTPLSTPVLVPEPAWGRDVDHEVARAARAAAVAAGQPSYRVPKVGKAGDATFWINNASAPEVMERYVQPVGAKRHTARPSGAAYKKGKRLGRDVIFSSDYPGAEEDWSVEDDAGKMPDELKEEDGGWVPGPCARQKPTFCGRTPGPADPTLSAASTEIEVMQRLLTDQVVSVIARCARQHAEYFRSEVLKVDSAKELAACNDSIESSMDWELSNLTGASVRLWLAAKLRVACMSDAVNEAYFWDKTSHLYDELLDRKLPYTAYQWFNRQAQLQPPPPPLPRLQSSIPPPTPRE